MKDWFKARNVWGAAILTMSDAEAGRLAKAIWGYTMTHEQSNLSGAERGTFAMIQMQLDLDEQIDAEISEKRAIAGSIGGKQTQANASKENSEEANEANADIKNKNKNKNQNQNKNKSENKNEDNEEMCAREARFDRFWALYPRKTAKQEAEKAFKRVDPDDELLETMIAAVEKQKKSEQWTRDGGQYIPHPATWLNQKRWTDEMPDSHKQTLKVVNAAKYDQRDYTEDDLAGDNDLLKECEEMIAAGIL